MAQSDSVQDPKERALRQDVASFGHLCTLGVSDTCLSAVDRVTCVQGLQTAVPQHWGQTSDIFTLFGISSCYGLLVPFPSPSVASG